MDIGSDPRYFSSADEFRRWLEEHHATETELWVGFFKVKTGRPSLTWPESVDEALCFGWIDGIRKRIDDERYVIRFTPRKKTSTWSAVNIRRVGELTEEGRMRPAGLEAFQNRTEDKSARYSYENRPRDLPEPYRSVLKGNSKAWADFQARPPSYRRAATWWIVSAKREATREKRLGILIECSSRGEMIPPLKRLK